MWLSKWLILKLTQMSFLGLVQKIAGKISENDIIKYRDSDIGKIMIDEPYSFALVKVVDPDLKEFHNTELTCSNSKVKILKPDWIL